MFDIIKNPILDIGFLYQNSKIDLSKIYDDFIVMSVKTSNNQDIIDKMPYWKFINLTKKLGKYIESENKTNNGSGGGAEEQTNKLMSNAKSSLPKTKLPKTPKFR